jgi:hypothetical protein
VKLPVVDERVLVWARSLGIDVGLVPADTYWRADRTRGLLHYEQLLVGESGALVLDRNEDPVRVDVTVPLPDVDAWGRPIERMASW